MQRVENASDVVKAIDETQIRYHKIGAFDIDGIFRGKYVERQKFLSTLESGFGFCDVVMGWDSSDALLDNLQVSGWHTGYRDAPVKLDPTTYRRIPFEEATSLVFGNFTGDYGEVCPRTLLSRVVERARAMGFEPKGSLEYEFFVFDETPDSVRAKGYRNLKPFTPGMFGYSMIRSSVHADLYREILDTFAAFDCEIEGLHTETGPGVLEAAIRYDDVLRAADKGALFKTYMKVLAQKRNLMATFMAKWDSKYPGQSGHIHLSLVDRASGRNAFFDDAGAHQMSDVMKWFVAGQVRYMPEVLAMVCSTINAYRRMVPGMWAPTSANWGVENRTTAIRVIAGSPKSQRAEYRIGPADANPYLALAAALASGLRGIEEKLALPDMVVGNAPEAPAKTRLPLPTTLRDAADALAGSKAAREMFGDAFVDHYAATRHWEDREFRKHVADWDLARYFEII